MGILRHEKKKRRLCRFASSSRVSQHCLDAEALLDDVPFVSSLFSDANAYQFDMVILMRLQIFPQDAIGKYSEQKQVIIAGDTKQLPPTNFFAASTSNGSDGYDDDEGYDEEVYDSILEETANILPNRTLLWHYRSKHEHLIAFSNQEIYKNELNFPKQQRE